MCIKYPPISPLLCMCSFVGLLGEDGHRTGSSNVSHFDFRLTFAGGMDTVQEVDNASHFEVHVIHFFYLFAFRSHDLLDHDTPAMGGIGTIFLR